MYVLILEIISVKLLIIEIRFELLFMTEVLDFLLINTLLYSLNI